MSPVLTPHEEIAAIIDRSKQEPPKVCHTIENGWALCGAFKSKSNGGTHSMGACKAAGHRICVVCAELDRQLGDDSRIVA